MYAMKSKKYLKHSLLQFFENSKNLVTKFYLYF